MGVAVLYFSSKVIWNYYQPALRKLLLQRDLTTDLDLKHCVFEKYDEMTDAEMEKRALLATVDAVRCLEPLRQMHLVDFEKITHIAARFIRREPSPTSVTEFE